MAGQDQVIRYIQDRAREFSGIRKISLFGSRARGDFRDRSDFDVAVWADTLSDGQWARFCLEVEENMPSLCGIDLVRVAPNLDKQMKQQIQDHGRVIYEAEE